MEHTIVPISKPSQFYQAIRQALQALALQWEVLDIVEDVIIKSYQGPERQAQAYAVLTQPTIFIEFEWQVEHALNSQGQYGHAYHIKLHCAVPKRPLNKRIPALRLSCLA